MPSLIFFLCQFCQRFFNFINLFQESAVCFIDFLHCFCFRFHWALLLIISFFLLISCLICYCFSGFLSWVLRLFEIFLLFHWFNAINLPFITALAVPHLFWDAVFHFYSGQCIFKISLQTSCLTHRLFRSVLFSF